MHNASMYGLAMTTAIITEHGDHLSRIVASNVRAEMARYHVTQQRIAAELGIKQQNVSDRLRGRTPFTLDEVGLIAPLFDMSAAELIAGIRAGGTPPPVLRPRRDSNAGRMAYIGTGSHLTLVGGPIPELVAA